MLKNFIIKKTNLIALLLLMLWIPAISAAGKSEQGEVQNRGPLVVGSKIDTEGDLLGSMMVLLLQDGGFEVIDRTKTGATSVVREAIIAGEIDMYPEYTGNGYYLFSGKTEAELWKDPATAYETVKKLDYEANSIVWLQPAPANNTWAIAIRGDLARQENLSTMEDLAAFIRDGGEFKIAGSEEFVSSEAALPAFEKGYGFTLEDNQMIVFSSGNTAVTEQAASRGTDGVNAAMAYGTDGQLAALDLKVMTDTLGIQPVYEPAPIIRSEVLDQFPEIKDILEPVFLSLDLETLQALNGQISVQGVPAQSVALFYLQEAGFLE